jgi:release factor glutamine methyltransferase
VTAADPDGARFEGAGFEGAAGFAPLVLRLRAAGCVFAEEEAALILEQADAVGGGPAEVDRLATAREGGLPLEQVLGWAALAGVRVAVEPGVFVPRRRTELMVAAAVALGLALPAEHGPVVLLDLCCGSGAVGAAVSYGLRAAGAEVEVTAADVDPVAVRCARRNLPGARVLQSDLFAGLPADLRNRVDVLTANVPYVPTDALALMPREAREHEPARALDGGSDGLEVLRRVAVEAPAWLAPGGTLLVETSERQVFAAQAAMAAAGLTPSVRTDDDLGAVVVVGSRGGEPSRPRR